jgi:hypothetical protein
MGNTRACTCFFKMTFKSWSIPAFIFRMCNRAIIWGITGNHVSTLITSNPSRTALSISGRMLNFLERFNPSPANPCVPNSTHLALVSPFSSSSSLLSLFPLLPLLSSSLLPLLCLPYPTSPHSPPSLSLLLPSPGTPS